MALSQEIMSQFAKLVTKNNNQNVEGTVYGTVIVDGNGNKYVKLDGSDQLTPLNDNERPSADSTTVSFNEGERVSVVIKNHTATITGNVSSPAARTGDVEELGNQISKIQEFDILIGEQIQAQEGYIQKLQTDKANIADLEAAEAKITELETKKASIEELNATKADITNLKADKLDVEVANATFATIENLNASDAKVTQLEATNVEITNKLTAAEAEIDNLEATMLTVDKADIKYATIENLNSINANVDTLEAEVADIDTLIFGSATGNTIQTSFANAVIAQLGNAQIKSAMIENVSADKINAGDVNTNRVRVVSEDGRLVISDETIQISDVERVRVQIGKDASNDYSINIWDAEGNLMFSKGGITDSAIKEAIIRNNMVADDANISASKLDISSLFVEINNSTETINANKVLIDTDSGTLDVVFTKMESDISDLSKDVTSQGTELSVVQGQISSKVWQQDINEATKELGTQYSSLKQSVDGISTTVASHTSQIGALDTRVNDAETQINQNREEISLKASKEELTNTDNKINDSLEGLDEVNKQLTNMGKSVSDLTIESNKIKASIGSIQYDIDDISGKLVTTQEDVSSLKLSSQDMTLKFENIETNGVDKVITETGFTFDSNGMTIDDTDSLTKTQVTPDGMTVYRKDAEGTTEEVLEATSEGVNATNLHAKTYLIIGGRSRFENYGTNRTGCFWIGG